MSDPLEDQVRAASAEARRNIARGLGLNHDRLPKKGSSPLFEELWETHGTSPRCLHLNARPVQPWYMALPFRTWYCSPCAAALAESRRGVPFDPIENFTCDHCRTYVRSLVPAIIRQDLWVFVLHLCPRCETGAIQQGATPLTNHPDKIDGGTS